MARTKVTPRKGDKGGKTRILRTRAVVYAEGKERRSLSPVHPPSPAQEAPLEAGKIMRRITEAEHLEGVGRSPSSLLTQQLAAEARPSMLGREEPVRRKVQPTMGGKAPPWKAFLKTGKVKKTHKY